MKNLYASGQSLTFILRNLDLWTPTVSYIIKNDYNRSKSYKGPAEKLKKYEELRIKREISILQNSTVRVTASKLKINLALAAKNVLFNVN